MIRVDAAGKCKITNNDVLSALSLNDLSKTEQSLVAPSLGDELIHEINRQSPIESITETSEFDLYLIAPDEAAIKLRTHTYSASEYRAR